MLKIRDFAKLVSQGTRAEKRAFLDACKAYGERHDSQYEKKFPKTPDYLRIRGLLLEEKDETENSIDTLCGMYLESQELSSRCFQPLAKLADFPLSEERKRSLLAKYREDVRALRQKNCFRISLFSAQLIPDAGTFLLAHREYDLWSKLLFFSPYYYSHGRPVDWTRLRLAVEEGEFPAIRTLLRRWIRNRVLSDRQSLLVDLQHFYSEARRVLDEELLLLDALWHGFEHTEELFGIVLRIIGNLYATAPSAMKERLREWCEQYEPRLENAFHWFYGEMIGEFLEKTEPVWREDLFLRRRYESLMSALRG